MQKKLKQMKMILNKHLAQQKMLSSKKNLKIILKTKMRKKF